MTNCKVRPTQTSRLDMLGGRIHSIQLVVQLVTAIPVFFAHRIALLTFLEVGWPESTLWKLKHEILGDVGYSRKLSLRPLGL